MIKLIFLLITIKELSRRLAYSCENMTTADPTAEIYLQVKRGI